MVGDVIPTLFHHPARLIQPHLAIYHPAEQMRVCVGA
jgi:hypothetical protein